MAALPKFLICVEWFIINKFLNGKIKSPEGLAVALFDIEVREREGWELGSVKIRACDRKLRFYC
jgi:hypothetical protein